MVCTILLYADKHRDKLIIVFIYILYYVDFVTLLFVERNEAQNNLMAKRVYENLISGYF